MGSDIFNAIWLNPFKIEWICRRQDDVTTLRHGIEKKLRKMVKREMISAEVKADREQNIRISTAYESLAECDLVIESIIENIETKQELFKNLEKIVNDSCILTTNTSSIPLETVFELCQNKSRCFGLHFFYPISIINIVELNKIDASSQQLAEVCKTFLAQIEKKYIELAEPVNFILNKIYITMLAQAFEVYREGGVAVADLDEAVKTRFCLMGLFEVMDSVGINIIYNILTNFNNKRYAKLYDPLIAKCDQLLDKGFTGGNNGFYSYEEQHGSVNTELDNKDKYLAELLTKLECLLINEIIFYLSKDENLKQNISDGVKEALGLHRNPKVLAEELGYDFIKNKLSTYFDETRNVLYKIDEDILRQYIQ